MSDIADTIEFARITVAGALGIPVDEVSTEARMYELPSWDSFGHLSIILALEEALSVQIMDDVTFSRLTSIEAISGYLKHR